MNYNDNSPRALRNAFERTKKENEQLKSRLAQYEGNNGFGDPDDEYDEFDGEPEVEVPSEVQALWQAMQSQSSTSNSPIGGIAQRIEKAESDDEILALFRRR